MGIPAVTLGDGYTGGIPAVSATYALGAQWAQTAGLTMHMNVNVSRVLTTTENVIAESKGGDANNVVMAGAHLDSVEAGPGINDNGSGSSALIETAEQMAKVKPKNKVRFAWWGAEEASLVGSTFYVGSLTDEEAAAIELYLNFDMIGSPNYGLFILDGDGGAFGTDGSARLGRHRGALRAVLRGAGRDQRPQGLRRALGLRRVHGRRHPGGRSVHRRRGPEDRAAGRVVGWHRGRRVRPVLPRRRATPSTTSAHKALALNADAVAYAVYLYASGREAINQD